MTKTLKMTFGIILAFALCISLLPSAAFADPEEGTAIIKLYVNDALQETRRYNVGDTFTVYTAINAATVDNGKFSTVAGEQYYTSSMLQRMDELNGEDLIEDVETVFPIMASKGNALGNGMDEGALYFSGSTPSKKNPFIFASDDAYVVVTQYKVTAGGEGSIETYIKTLVLTDDYLTRVIDHYRIMDGLQGDVNLISHFDETGTLIQDTDINTETPKQIGTWDELYEAFQEGGEVVLTADIDFGNPSNEDEYLHLPFSKALTLDLNGHIINRCLTQKFERSHMIVTEGDLTIKDSNPAAEHDPAVTYTDPVSGDIITVNGGILTGGYSDVEGGAISISIGTCNIEGGTILACRASLGGGICVVSGALNMTGGTICGCSAECGGAILSSGSLSVEGSSFIYNIGESGAAVYTTTPDVRINNNIMFGNQGDTIIDAGQAPDETGLESSGPSLEIVRFADLNWFGNVAGNYSNKPKIEIPEDRSFTWYHLNAERVIDEETGKYALSVTPYLYSPTSGTSLEITPDTYMLPEINLGLSGDGAVFDGSDTITLSSAGFSTASFDVEPGEGEYTYTVGTFYPAGIQTSDMLETLTFERTIEVNGGEPIDYDPSAEYSVLPFENGEEIPLKVIEGKTISVSLKNAGGEEAGTFTSDVSENGTFSLDLANTSKGEYEATFEIPGFKPVTGTITVSSPPGPLYIGTWDELFEAFQKGGEIVLTADIDFADPTDSALMLYVPSSKTLTLDLNGHIINRCLTEALANSRLIQVNGNLTIKDSNPTAEHDPAVTCTNPLLGNTLTVNGGIITGGYSADGGGAIKVTGGTCTMEGGTILACRAKFGGGVYVMDGAFNMTGGAICGCEAKTGAAIYNTDTLSVEGSSIIYNSEGDIICSTTQDVRINHNAIVDNSGNYIYAPKMPESINPKPSGPSLERMDFADSNWFGNTAGNYSTDPNTHADNLTYWYYLDTERVIDEETGKYSLTVTPYLYSSTTGTSLEVTPDTYMLPEINLGLSADGAVFDGSDTITLSRAGFSSASFDVEPGEGEYTYTIGTYYPALAQTDYMLETLSFERTIEANGGRRITYNGPTDITVSPFENGEAVPAKVIEGKTISVTARGVDNDAIAFGSAAVSESGSFELDLGEIAPGVYEAEITVPGFKPATVSMTVSQKTYPLYIGGVQFRDNNLNVDADDSADITSGTATYEPENNKLILDGFKYSGAGSSEGDADGAVLYTGDNDLTIYFKGENNIRLQKDSDRNDNGAGIYSGSNATLHFRGEDENASLYASACDGYNSCYGISCAALSLDTGTLKAEAGTATELSLGIACFYDDVSVSNAAITGIGHDVTGTYRTYSEGFDIMGNFTAENSTVTGKAGKATLESTEGILSRSYGMLAMGGVTFKNSKVQLTADGAEDVDSDATCRGITTLGAVNISGGDVICAAGPSDRSPGISVGNTDDSDIDLDVFCGSSEEDAEKTELSAFYGNQAAYSYVHFRALSIFTVAVTPGAGMTKTSGTESQQVTEGSALEDIVYTADTGYYFPEDYGSDYGNGIDLTRNSLTQITVSGTPQESADITLPAATEKTKEATPKATFTATGDSTGTLSNLSLGMTYSVAGGEAIVCTGDSLELSELVPCEITVIKPGNGTTTFDSDALIINITKAEKPNLTVTQPSSPGGKGTINTTSAHEISGDNGATWTDCSENEEAEPGEYLVRVKANGASLASEAQEITIEKFAGFKVSFNANGGSVTPPDAATDENGRLSDLPAPERAKYRFKGWYTEAEGGEKVTADTQFSADTEIYAQWNKKSSGGSGGVSLASKTEDKKDDEKLQFILTIGKKEALVWGEVKENDVAPVIVKDRTMLPARFVAENLGADVSWDGEARKVLITKDGTKIEIIIDSETAYINGKATALDSPAFIENDRTYTPLRFIAETLGAEVSWKEDTRQVIITKAE